MQTQITLWADNSCSIKQTPYRSDTTRPETVAIQTSSLATVSIVEKRATKIRYLTSSLPAEFKKMAIRLMDFRTKIIGENLFYHDNLLSAERADAVFQRKDPLVVARFSLPIELSFQPATSAAGFPSCIQLFSMDKLVHISIPCHLQFFRVSFPIKVSETDPTDKSVMYYTVITQIHPTQDPPRYWVYPLLLALQSLYQAKEHRQTYPDLEGFIGRLESLCLQYRLMDMKSVSSSIYNNAQQQQIQDATEFDLMPDVVCTQDHATIQLPRFNYQESLPSHSSNTNFRGHTELNSFAKADAIRAFECDLGFFRALVFNQDTVEIQIILSDETVIQTTPDFKFLRVWMAGSWVEEMLLVEMVMQLMGPYQNHQTGTSYAFREIVTLALSLYQNVHSNMLATFSEKALHLPLQPISTDPPSFSSTIKRLMDVPDVGEFVYYIDGRSKCRFADRTIIELPKILNGGLATILDQAGAKYQVRISNPVGFEEHIRAMIEFIDFVTQSHEKNTREALEKQKILDRLTIQRAKSLEQREKLENVLYRRGERE